MKGYVCAFVGQADLRVAAFRRKFSGTDVASRLVRGTFWASIGALVSRMFAMVASIIVGRLLGKEGFGELGMVYSTMGMFGVFAGIGLGSAATKYVAEFRLSDSARTARIFKIITSTSLVSGSLVMIIALLLSPWLAAHTLNRPGIAPLLQAGALLLFVSALTGVQQGVLAGFESFRKIARINLYQGLASPFIAVPCVLLYGVQGAVTSYTINSCLTLLLCIVAVRAELAGNRICLAEPLGCCWAEWPILIKFVLPALFSSSLLMPVTWFTNTVLVSSPGGYGELGLFNAANQWRQLIVFLPSILSAAILPILSQAHGQDDQADFRRVVSMNLRMIWIVALPATIVIITLGKPLAVIFGREFAGAAPLISVLMTSCFLTVVNGPVGTALTGAGKMWTGVLMNLGWASALVLFSLLLIPAHGGLGLALAYLLAYLLHTLWQMIYVEIRLAPRTIIGQWHLVLLSVSLLTIGVWVSIKGYSNVSIGTSLVMFSSIPLVSFCHEQYKKLFAY